MAHQSLVSSRRSAPLSTAVSVKTRAPKRSLPLSLSLVLTPTDRNFFLPQLRAVPSYRSIASRSARRVVSAKAGKEAGTLKVDVQPKPESQPKKPKKKEANAIVSFFQRAVRKRGPTGTVKVGAAFPKMKKFDQPKKKYGATAVPGLPLSKRKQKAIDLREDLMSSKGFLRSSYPVMFVFLVLSYILVV